MICFRKAEKHGDNTMSRCWVTVGTLLFVLVTGSALRAETAEEMMSSCKYFADAEVRDQQVTLPGDFESGRCWGAFGAIQAAIVRVFRPAVLPAFSVCAPATSTRTQIIRIFLEYAKRNPKTLNEDYFEVALTALQEAFPCRQTAPKR